MSSVVYQSLGRFPVVARSKAAIEKPRRSSTKKAQGSETHDDKNAIPTLSEMRNALLMAAFPIESSDSSWIVATDDSILRRLPIAADKYRELLNSLSKKEISARYNSFNKSKRYGLLVEANCRSACRKPFWTAEEATFYSFGLEFPEDYGLSMIRQELEIAVHGKNIEGAKRPRLHILAIPEEYRFLAHILDRLDFIQRAIGINELPEKIKPGQFIRWAERRGIGLPYRLMSGAKDVAIEILDWQDRYEAVQKFLIQSQEEHQKLQTEALNENTDLKKTITLLKTHIDSLVNHGDDPRLKNVKAQYSMQIMLICMAREKYGWNKSNEAAAKLIASATAGVKDGGLSTSTIKRHLEDAEAAADPHGQDGEMAQIPLVGRKPKRLRLNSRS